MKRFGKLVCLLSLAGCAGTPGSSGITAAAGTWHSRPDMREARAAHAVVSTRDSIYALAGTGPDGSVLEVERFDGRQWLHEAQLPGGGLNAPAAAVVKGRIYLIGGFNTTTNVPSSDVLVYDLARKSWSNAAPLPALRGGHAAAVLNGEIHVVGGGNSRSTIADHSVFDPANNQWRDAAPLPRSEGSPALVEFHGKLYAIGGRSGPADFGDVYVYDSAADRWSSGPAIEPRGTAGAVVYCGAIHLFGGESQAANTSLDDVFRLDFAQGRWEKLAPMPHARNFARAVVFERGVYVVGGSPTAGSSHASAGSKIVESYSATCG
jgi:N-acetylneuraminic acid mutarotase